MIRELVQAIRGPADDERELREVAENRRVNAEAERRALRREVETCGVGRVQFEARAAALVAAAAGSPPFAKRRAQLKADEYLERAADFAERGAAAAKAAK